MATTAELEASVSGFQAAFVANYGSGTAPGWLQALLAALEAALPSILAGCGVAATHASIQDAVNAAPIATSIKMMGVCRDAGVPLRDRRSASLALFATIKATTEVNMNNLITFAQAA